MLQFTEGLHSQLSHQTRHKLFSYRYQVFVEQLAWELDTEPNIETDQFDHDQTLYIIANDRDNDVVGCARLLPTTLPYLLERVFPELLNGMLPPKDQTVWELSRFTSMDLKSQQLKTNGQLSSPATAVLLKRSMTVARQHGAKYMISVSPIGIERLLRGLGIIARRAGPPKIIDGYSLIACWVDLLENQNRY
ncbi:acyl-homoserine-lactone synthase [Microbulbifer sp. ZKSA006]|uniref:acyl-homoserine-lactone synthase n=1 Tax=Microbulbifer sp. ZKSA006 TaxID=3243390 RepID=UPI00403929F9